MNANYSLSLSLINVLQKMMSQYKNRGTINEVTIFFLFQLCAMIDQETQDLKFFYQGITSAPNIICGETSIGSRDGLMIIACDFAEMLNSRFAIGECDQDLR
jgi:hypothetical protein